MSNIVVEKWQIEKSAYWEKFVKDHPEVDEDDL